MREEALVPKSGFVYKCYVSIGPSAEKLCSQLI
jgi:hypothetical protein